MIRWFEVVIGLETHAQLVNALQDILRRVHRSSVQRPTRKPRAVDLALPGVLPVLNRECGRACAIKFGLAVGCHQVPPAVHLRAQELFLSGLCPRATRSASSSCRSWQGGGLDHPHWRGCPSSSGSPAPIWRKMPASPLHEGLRGPCIGHRSEPCRHTTPRNRHRARHAQQLPRPWSMPRRCTRWWCGWAFATATCRKARFRCGCQRIGAKVPVRREARHAAARSRT